MKKYKSIAVLLSLIPSSVFAEVPLILDTAIKGGNNRNYAQISAFTPLVRSENNLVFNDIRFMQHLPHHKKGSKYKHNINELNLGLGYRQLVEADTILGGAAYFDTRRANISNKRFSQATVNMHLLTSSWQLNANGYIPLGNKKISRKKQSFSGKALEINRDIFFILNNDIVTEKAMSGCDFRISRTIPNLEKLRVGLVGYHFKGAKPVNGLGTEISLKINPSITFEGSYTYDKVRKSNILIGARFFFSNHKLQNLNAKERLFGTKVERDLDVITFNANSNQQIKSKQDNLYAIKSDDLANINDGTSIQRNKEILYKLNEAIKNRKTLVLVSDTKEFNFANAEKAQYTEYKDQIDSFKVITQKSFNEGKDMNQINAQVSAEQKPFVRQLRIIASQTAYQEKQNNANIIYIGKTNLAFDDNSYDKVWQDLYALYARASATPNKSYYYNLPVFGNVEIKRAGSVLLTKENSNIYTMLGADASSAQKHGNNAAHAWFSGRSEERDKGIINTIIRETFEESAGTVALTPEDVKLALSKNHFFYDSKAKTLAIYYLDKEKRYSVAQCNNNFNKIKNDPNITKSMKEFSSFSLVPLKEMQDLRDRMSKTPLPTNRYGPEYMVKSSGGSPVRVMKEYGESFGNQSSAILQKIIQDFSK